ncbi:unknownprotein [Zostera marina]|uniref:Transmembrane protein n=1 Tax=Zostera marina TaxID=29655 RepID=A0A0K9PD92_ZOSMR|nr:unknownprotein [Zostera marina]
MGHARRRRDLIYVPFVVVILIAAHVIALVYWIYRVATEKQPQRRKSH